MAKAKTVETIKKDDLSSFVPETKETNYLKRNIQMQVEKIISMPADKRKPIFFVGESAVGKTAMVRNLAYEKKLPFMLIEIDASMNFNDLLYKVHFKNATAYYEPGLLIKFIQQPSFVLFDELPSANPEIFFKLHELLQEKRIYVKELDQVFEVHDQCYLFAAGNYKNAMYIGNNRMNAALISRFMVKEIADFTRDEVEAIIDYKDKAMKKALIDFYYRVKDIVKKQQKKYIITLRNLQSITGLLEAEFSINDAVQFGFLDSILVNNSMDELYAVKDLAITTLPGYVVSAEDKDMIRRKSNRY